MIELLILASMGIAVLGSVSAGLWDLKTSNIPDSVVALMITSGIFIWYVVSLAAGSFSLVISSLILGTITLAAGWALYSRGLWGLGDACLLAAIFYLLPDILFLIDYLINLVFVMLAYVILYTLIAGATTKGVFGNFLSDVTKKRFAIPAIAVALIAVISAIYMYGTIGTISIALLAAPFFFVFAVYARSAEKLAFRHEIPASHVKKDDVLLAAKKWKGLTETEAAEIRKQKGSVIIKDGVRLGPVFPIALILTILYGSVIFLI